MSAGQSTEHLRNYSVIDPDAKKYGYYDPTRVNLNFEVGKGGVIMPVRKQYSLVQRFRDNLRSRGITDPNEVKRKKGLEPNRRTVANVILGGSRDQMHKLAFGNQVVDLEKGADNRHIQRQEDIEKWAKDMYDFMAKRFGEENIVAFIVHLDEKNPHVHCTLIPVNEKNKISYHDVFGHNREECRKTFKELHDQVAEVNKKWNLERGRDINTTGARHRTSEEYWMWLRQRCNEMEQEKASQQEILNFLNKEIQRADIKSKGLSTMIQNLQRRQRLLLEELQDLQDKIARGELTAKEVEAKREKLESQLKEVEEKITDKQAKLEDAENQLKDIEKHLYDLGGQYSNLIKERDALKRTIVNNLEPKSQDYILRDMQSIAFDNIIEVNKAFLDGLKNYASQIGGEVEKFIDNLLETSGMEEVAERSTEVAAVATALFFGYIDQATNFAVSHGGGGGPGDGWGRNPNEDDDSYKRRCYLMASMMMRPAGKREAQTQSRPAWRRR